MPNNKICVKQFTVILCHIAVIGCGTVSNSVRAKMFYCTGPTSQDFILSWRSVRPIKVKTQNLWVRGSGIGKGLLQCDQIGRFFALRATV